MGNNNTTAILTEEESSKLESNGMSSLGSVSVDTTQDQVFLAGEGKNGEKEKESSKLETNEMSLLESVSVETAQDQLFLAGDGKDGDKENESSKLETNGMSLLDSVSVENTQGQVVLADEGKDGDEEEGNPKVEPNGMSTLDSVSVKTTQDQLSVAADRRYGDEKKEIGELETNGMSPLESISIETTVDQLFLAGEGKDGDAEKESMPDGVKVTEPQSKELVDEPKVKRVEEEMHSSGLESSVNETDDEKLQKQTSVEEGVKTMFEATEVEELSMIGTQSVVRNLNTTESGKEEKLCLTDEIVGNEENMVNESLAEVFSTGKVVVNVVQETGMEQRTGGDEFPEIQPHNILNLDHRADIDDDEVTNEGKANKETFKSGLQEPNVIQESGLGVHKEENDMNLKTEAILKRMSRCRSLPVSHNSRVIGDTLAQQLVSEVTFPSRNKMCLEKPNISEALLVPCVGSNKAEETIETITESNKEATLEIQRTEERSDEPIEKTSLLFQDKTEIYEATIDVEEKTVMLKRSESMRTRVIEESPGLLNKHSDDNLEDKKASSGSMKGIVRKRNKSSILGTCLCCTTAMN